VHHIWGRHFLGWQRALKYMSVQAQGVIGLASPNADSIMQSENPRDSCGMIMEILIRVK
jgi:hypothetical protein